MISARHASNPRARPGRRGASLVEAAISMTVLMMFLIGILDYSIASFRIQVLSHIAHRLARESAVHGPGAPAGWRNGTWGPAAFDTTLDAADPIAEVGRTVSAGLDPAEVRISITWPNGTNAPGNPVVVEAETDWTPSLLRPTGMSVVTLRGRSVHVIAH